MLIRAVVALEIRALSNLTKLWSIRAIGDADGLGWTNPVLSFKRIERDVAVFEFMADGPKSSIPVANPITAVTSYEPPIEIRAIRVESSSNSIEEECSIIQITSKGQQTFDFPEYSNTVEPFLDDEDDDDDQLYEAISLLAKVCKTKTLLKIPVNIEVKTKRWKFYRRITYKTTYLEYCYPSDLEEDAQDVINQCIPIAVAAAVAAWPGGAGASLSAFISAMKACAAAEIADKLKLDIKTKKIKGAWKRI